LRGEQSCVHNRLIVAIADDLATKALPRYYVEAEERAYLAELEGGKFVGRPDVAVRGRLTPDASLYTFGVRQPIPTFPLPLRPRDEEPMADIGRLLHELYDGAGYDLRLDYAKEPESPLRPNDTLWADQLLREKGLR
jgi:hypothetical protein